MKHFSTGILVCLGFVLAAITLPLWGPIWAIYAVGKSFNTFDPNQERYPWL